MTRDVQAIRSPDTSEWHIVPVCPEFPRSGYRRDLNQLGPADELCSWCASHGSGSDELDDRAGAVLRILLRDDRMIESGIRAHRALWAFGDPVFVFWRGVQPVTQRVARTTLLRFDSEMIAEAIARTLTRPPN